MLFFRKAISTIVVVSVTITLLFSQQIPRREYIEMYKATAIRQMMSHGIPASIIMAQACLESGDGNSTLAKEANNHFGIKCHDWEGERIYHDDDQKGECFRKYANADESFRDHSDFLRYRERYASLFDLDPYDYKAWAYGLKEAGYATNPNYPQLLIKIIEDYSLYELDKIPNYQIPPSPTQITAPATFPLDSGSDLYKLSLHRQIYRRNGVNYIVATSYDTYSSLASEFRLLAKELLKYNDLKKEQPVEDGTVVYIERKQKEGDRYLPKHVVGEDETMYEISQKYGIRLKRLYKMNRMKAGTEPNEGNILNLR